MSLPFDQMLLLNMATSSGCLVHIPPFLIFSFQLRVCRLFHRRQIRFVIFFFVIFFFVIFFLFIADFQTGVNIVLFGSSLHHFHFLSLCSSSCRCFTVGRNCIKLILSSNYSFACFLALVPTHSAISSWDFPVPTVSAARISVYPSAYP